jgi:glycerophosphoryl diester phosphodiesterase
MAKYPENTLASLRAAIELGCDAVEFDLHLSRDGRIVVIHDDALNRTTNGQGSVRERTLAELRRLDAGSWFDPRFRGERIPTLEEVLDLAPKDVGLYAEVKDGRPPMLERLVPLVLPRAESVVVHSFDAGFLEEFHRAVPHVRTGLLGHADKLDMLAEARRLGCRGIHPCMEGLTAEMVGDWQQAGFEVMVWTVKDEADARHALALRPDAIGVNCPDVLLRLVGR